MIFLSQLHRRGMVDCGIMVLKKPIIAGFRGRRYLNIIPCCIKNKIFY